MEDPQGAAAHALKTLKKPDGTVMIVEPFVNDKLEDNLNPIGAGYIQVYIVYMIGEKRVPVIR